MAAQAQFTIDRGDLAPVLDRAHRIVERRNTIPILSNLRLVAEGDRLVVTATDLDIEMQADAPLAATGADLAVTLPATLLRDFVKKLPEKAEIAFKLEGGQVKVSAGRTRATLHCLPPEDFPEMQADGFSHRFAVAARDFAPLLETCQFAMSNEETRYYLNGIYLHVVEDVASTRLRSVATDGHRLARREMAAPDGAAGMPGIILPRKTVAEAIALLAGADEATVEIEISDAKIRLTIGKVTLTSKLIDGTFPDYARVIPTGNANSFTLARETFVAALDRVTTITADRARAVRIAFAETEAALECVNPDSGDARDEVSVKAATGEPVTIGFNGRYALEVAGRVAGPEIVFELADGGAAALVRGADPDPLFVIMPMRI
ncbi:DNA polymerase III subunit beta [Chelativorans sp. ZYF759]|uniref:DNA polymerase III subunit beta n=1 Tax=Chelativorans sp. ZYF759 TaxID=2692213 RepID=UPI00145C5601|nr:DNA polymerase III subunit beta [Chelativorans sp. ZYF759]NMG39851.1 DNA polymerase III subunit beta [Chelativorans sp. ZYF759]